MTFVEHTRMIRTNKERMGGNCGTCLSRRRGRRAARRPLCPGPGLCSPAAPGRYAGRGHAVACGGDGIIFSADAASIYRSFGMEPPQRDRALEMAF